MSLVFTEEYPSSISQMKCQKVLLEILGLPTAKTLEKESRPQNFMVRLVALINVTYTHS